MREALRGLTVRGRAFVAAGLTAVVCAIVLGQPALNRVGVLLVALPLITVAVLGRTRYRLALVRSVQPPQVSAGQPARVALTLTNEGRTPSGLLLLEEQVPYVLGTRPRFVLEGIGRGWSRHASYQVRSDVRGRYEIGPMTVRVTDPFGLVELGRAFRATSSLTVTPRTTALQPIPLGGGHGGSGDQRARAFATGSAEDVTVREYRRGDDLRRVHWRSSARTGELMVRREEQPWEARATVFVDNRIIAHQGSGPASSFETAVSVTASIAVHLARRGYAVRLVTATGEDPATALHHGSAADPRRLLEALAVLPLVAAVRLDSAWWGEQSVDGVTVAVVGQVHDADAAILRRMARHTGLALAVALDAPAWLDLARGEDATSPTAGPAPAARPRTTAAATPVLARQGWRVAELGPHDLLERAWQELGSPVRVGSSS